MPKNRGPLIARATLYSHTAWVTARMCSSLKLRRREEPLWPEVPKLTACVGSMGSGCCVK